MSSHVIGSLCLLEAMWIGRGYTCDYVGRAYAMIHGMLRVICVGATVIEFTEVMRLADVFCTSMNNQGMWVGLYFPPACPLC